MTDDEYATWNQQELDERRRREDELFDRLRIECSGFRKCNDEFSAEFNQSLKRLRQEPDHDRPQ